MKRKEGDKFKEKANQNNSRNEPVNCVGAVIIRNKKIFLVKRSLYKRSYPGYWCAPGGSIEDGETPQESVSREIKEEINCDFKIKKFLGKFLVREDGFTLRSFRFLGDIFGNLKLNKEATDFGWFSYKETQKMKIGFHYKKMLKLLYKQDIIK